MLRLNQRVTHLETFPESGRFVPEDPTETCRELIFSRPRGLTPGAGAGLLTTEPYLLRVA